MLYRIQNEILTVSISDRGAELQSVISPLGERVWQGDQAFWGDRAPILFPFCGRLWNQLGSVHGVPCKLPTHGFFKDLVTKAEQLSETEVAFELTESSESLAVYPFAFRMRVIYSLCGEELTLRAEVTNTGKQSLPYGYGGHPGFVVPFDGGAFEDYYLRFADGRGAQNIRFDPNNCFPIGGSDPLPLVDGDKLMLRDALFADGSKFFSEMAPEVTLTRDGSSHGVTLRYDGFRYLGIWKAVGGSFLCIEPWTSMPAMNGQSTELTEKKDLFHLAPGKTNVHSYTVRFY